MQADVEMMLQSSLALTCFICGLQKVHIDAQDVADAISDKEREDLLPSVMPIFKVRL